MEYAISGWTLFWFAIPMPLLVVWAIITFFSERGKEDK
ncbi:hypothetical protein M948_03015 [Virgibacillus sp. CM-4]|uniref:Uncharacterized protein n=1 Tax=Virgibacillus massiliensis TaxID=1462526 RepID=A0A024Q9S7_9BACI|nr:hypothetical protein M948_03015 [Virgibacillus sp. CM-4]CDQ38950.1 hypothetical protein BN990_01230 [Virgibacillus massiliensis]